MKNLKKAVLGQDLPKNLSLGHMDPYQSPNFLKFLFESSNDAIIINSSAGLITGWNKAAEKIYGYSALEIIGKHVSFLAPKGKKNQIVNILKKLRQGKNIREFETERIKKDGTPIYVSLTVSSIKDNSGKIIGFSAIVRDISNRRRIFLALEESEKKYRHLIEFANDAIILADAETGIITDANKKAEQLTGKSLKEIIGMHQTLLHPPEYAKKYSRLFKSQVKIEQGVTELVYVIHKSGKYIPVEISTSVIKGDDRKLIQGIFRDISERERINNLKKEFLSMAAHELKTPVTTLKLISQAHIAKFKRFGSNQIKLDELKLIDRELERLTQLINDILDDTRLESGKLFLKPELTNLNKLLSIVVKKMRPFSKQRISLEIPSEKLSIIADQQRIEQVIVNLISNASKYSQPKTKIIIGAKKNNDKVLFWVADQGLGIPKEKQKFIFDRFYQVKEKDSRGFGLGLYITKEIIKSHKGKIWVESVEGKGSTFYFTIPSNN